MMKLRNEQLLALCRKDLDAIKQAIAQKCNEDHAHWSQGAGELTRVGFAELALDRALGYDIFYRDDIVAFAEYMLAWGLGYESLPEMKERLNILDDRTMKGREKLYQLRIIELTQPKRGA